MINNMLLILIIAGVTLQQVMKKAYNTKVQGGAYGFGAATAFAALSMFLVTSCGDLNFSKDSFIYSVLFAACYCLGAIFSLLAINEGPLALTSLVIQYSLMIPTVYGLTVGDEQINVSLLIGIAFLLASLLFINLDKKGEKRRITVKWGIYAFLAFVGNGGCSTVQKIQQVNCQGQYKSEFMLIAYAISVVVLLAMALFSERKQLVREIKEGCIFWLLCGLGNGLVNFLVLILTNKMPSSVMFPLISAGGILATFLVSLFIYKEKLSKFQNLGLVLGIISVVFLNV